MFNIETITAALKADRNFFCGAEPIESIAQEWAGTGLSTEEAIGYMEARCFTATAAESLKCFGVTPEQAAKAAPKTVGYRDSIGYAVANGDLAASDVECL